MRICCTICVFLTNRKAGNFALIFVIDREKLLMLAVSMIWLMHFKTKAKNNHNWLSNLIRILIYRIILDKESQL
jgi:hypothetical protein